MACALYYLDEGRWLPEILIMQPDYPEQTCGILQYSFVRIRSL